ncbi:PRC-barrel domain-containing protein [Candidatus Peregrinibacteria bacterium]|nr:PRC-barrel domain-containing protein [Candidatus Peregrinibacteria bacterium]
MERFYTKIVGMPVVEDDGIRALARVKDVLMDPETGKVLAFVVNVSRNLVITPLDIISWHDVVHIRSRDEIISGDDILRVQTVRKSGGKIFHNRVETKGGKYLGEVADFSIDNHLMVLKKLFVAKDVLGLFRYDTRVIPAKNILEILPDKIVVKDDLATVKEAVEEKPGRRRAGTMEDMAVT